MTGIGLEQAKAARGQVMTLMMSRRPHGPQGDWAVDTIHREEFKLTGRNKIWTLVTG